ncbi:MAG: ABC transporter ATP-binding protein [Candidatus Micrarchaeia archaeon]
MVAALELKNVSVRYGSVQALTDCGLEVHAGESFGLLGPNGAGKSTLFKAVAGQVYYSGSICMFGHDIGKEKGARKELGIVPQDYAFFHDFTVEENLWLLGRLHGLRGKVLEQRVQELLDAYNLRRFRRRRAAELSGGFKRLLNIAASVIHSPRLLLLDEPTVGLDLDMRRRVWGVVKKLREEGVTLVLSTHYLEEAQVLCDRIAIIFRGKIFALGSPAELVKRHGGDALISAVVSTPVDALLPSLRELSGVTSVKVDESQLLVRCKPEVSSEIALEVMRLLDRHGVVFQKFSTKLPSLDDVFLNVVGTELGAVA